ASTAAPGERLEVRPGSVSGMLRKLDGLGLVEHEPYRGVRLTERGRLVALEVIRHHRLLELFLVESLGMGWDEVHAEAEVLEHVLSEELEELIAARLGHPTPYPRPRDRRRGRQLRPVRARAGRVWNVRPGLRRRSRDAPLPRRAWDHSRRPARGRRAPAVRRTAVRARRQARARPRRGARPGD